LISSIATGIASVKNTAIDYPLRNVVGSGSWNACPLFAAWIHFCFKMFKSFYDDAIIGKIAL
jgi:hypothetical protein